MKKFLTVLMSFACILAMTLAGCSKTEPEDQPVWAGGGSEEETEKPLEPEAGTNNVVAHRGGSAEAGSTFPDNSMASLRYAMELGCYASECDIYWTKDDKVVVAHADSKCQINGLHPWEATLEELQKAGNLSNGEHLPSLEEFIDEVMKEGSCTRLWLDIKNITYPSTLTEYPISACRRACEIIKEKKAGKYVEFICTGNATVMQSSFNYARAAGVEIGWMANRTPAEYLGSGYNWANLSLDYMSPNGDRTVDEFLKAGIDFSVYNVDTDADIARYMPYVPKMKAICTNYPKKLINKINNQ